MKNGFKKKKFRLVLLYPIITLLFFLLCTSIIYQYPSYAQTESSSCEEIPQPPLGTLSQNQNIQQTTQTLESINREVKDAVGPYNKKTGIEKQAIEKNVRDLLKKRKPYIIAIMRHDPDAALPLVISDTETLDTKMSNSNCVEKEETLEGTMEVIHSDSFNNKISDTRYTLVTGDNKGIALHAAKGSTQKLRTGMKIRIKGYKLDNDVVYDGFAPNTTQIISSPYSAQTTTSQSSTSSTSDSIGNQRTVVLLSYFSDTPQPPLTAADAQSSLITQMNAYYKELSYNKVTISGSVYGWYHLPITQTCDQNAIKQKTIAAADPYVDFTQVDRLVIVAPFATSSGGGCPFGGISTIGKDYISTADGYAIMSYSLVSPYYFGLDVSAHEYGHALGEDHSSFLNCGSVSYAPTGCTIEEYGDIYDVMGAHLSHMNAAHKEDLGWFDPSNITNITTSGNYDIEPLEAATTNRKVLKIKRSQYTDYLFIEYRQQTGYDANLNPDGNADVYQGATLHTLKTPIKSLLLDTSPPADAKTSVLKLNQSFTDAATGSIVKVTGLSSASLQVNVTLGKSDFTAPTGSITSPAANASLTGTVTVTANATDPSGVQKVEFYHRSASGDKLFATDTTAPYEGQLDTTPLKNGSRQLFARMYDNAGVAWNADANVGDTLNITVSINNPTPLVDTIGGFNAGNVSLKYVNQSGSPDTTFSYGASGDKAISGDWNADGIDTPGVYRNGTFYLRNSNSSGVADISIVFGQAGDVPIVGDWDGDGSDTIGVYRAGTFFLRNQNTSGNADMTILYGASGDTPVIGDWNGDGSDTIGVFRPTNAFFYLRNTNTTGVADISFNYGVANDKPFAGDWNGDGIDTIGIFRTDTFYLRNTNSSGFADAAVTLNPIIATPLIGKWK